MPESKRILGAFGEDVACRYLEQHGYKIIGRNYKCRMGEIDIIACNRRYVAFVEVKLRKSGRFVQAREYVTAQKQQRVMLAAQLWLAQNRTRLQPRFDVVEVYAPQGLQTEKLQIYHIEDAYQ